MGGLASDTRIADVRSPDSPAIAHHGECREDAVEARADGYRMATTRFAPVASNRRASEMAARCSARICAGCTGQGMLHADRSGHVAGRDRELTGVASERRGDHVVLLRVHLVS